MEVPPDKWERVKELFEAALEKPSEQRPQYLADACEDADLCAEVARLLANLKDAGSFLNKPVLTDLDLLTTKIDDGFLTPNQVLGGRFKLIRFIARGGMGEVYEAEDQELHESVALKLVRPELLLDPDARQRLRREVHLAKKVTHPNVCRTFDLFRHHDTNDPVNDLIFVSMELLIGETLSQYIRCHGRFTPTEALPLLTQIAGGMSAAHNVGVIHRDFKPGNIILVPQHAGRLRAVITDFGLALRSSGDATTVTIDANTSHGMAGTPAYMAPEQIEGCEVTSATDIYAFGLVIYEMMTGSRPFASETPIAAALKRLHESPPSPRSIIPDLDRIWESAILRCLMRDPTKRFISVDELVEALKGTSIVPLPTDEYTDFELTKLHTESGGGGATTRTASEAPPRPIWSRWPMPIGASIIAVGLALGWWLFPYHKAHALKDKDTIVLADFTNTTGDPVFDGTLRQGLAIQLEQSSFLSLISEQKTQQTLKMMGQPQDAKLTPEIAREVCQRTGSTAVVNGSISNLGSHYILGLKSLSCLDGSILAEKQLTANSKENVLNVLSDAAANLRGDLGESLRTVYKNDVPLEQATTPSLQALQAYSMGRENILRTKDFPKAVLYLRRATELDPNFAMAYAELGVAYGNLDQGKLCTETTKKAYELRERVSERERLYIESRYYADVTGDMQKARQVYELRVVANPRDYGALVNLSAHYLRQGQLDQSLETSRQAYYLGVQSSWIYDRLFESYLFLNRLDEARTIGNEAEGQHLDSPLLHYLIYQLAFTQNDSVGMAHQTAWADANQENAIAVLSSVSATAAYFGQIRKAYKLSRRIAETASGADHDRSAFSDIGDIALINSFLANPPQVRQLAGAAMKPYRDSWTQSISALTLALTRSSKRAQALADDLAQRYPEDTEVQYFNLPEIRAQLALNDNNPSKAIEMLRPATPYEMGKAVRLFPAYQRGQAYLALHNGAEAAEEFEKIVNHRTIVQNGFIGALARLQLGRAYAVQGDTAKATAAYQDFLTLWKDADPDIPILIAAKAEYAKLN